MKHWRTDPADRWRLLGVAMTLVLVVVAISEVPRHVRGALDVRAQRASLVERLAVAEADPHAGTRLAAEAARLDADLAALAAALPDGDRASALLDVLVGVADSTDVRLADTRFVEETRTKDVLALRLSTTAHGRFHAIMAFTNGLERQPHLLSVEYLRFLMPDADDESRDEAASLEAILGLTLHVLVGPDGDGAAMASPPGSASPRGRS